MEATRGGQPLPYAVFDDYRYSQRIAVVVRWLLCHAEGVIAGVED